MKDIFFRNIVIRNIVIRIGFSNTWLDIVHMSEEYLQPERTFLDEDVDLSWGGIVVYHWGMDQKLIWIPSLLFHIQGVYWALWGVNGVERCSIIYTITIVHLGSIFAIQVA